MSLLVRSNSLNKSTSTSEWDTLSTESGVGFADNFASDTRATLLTKAQGWEINVGAQVTFVGNPSGGNVERYQDPPPGGVAAKLDISTDTPGSGRSVYLTQHPEEGAVDGGPVLEIPLPNGPLSEYYVGFGIKFDSQFYNHDFGGDAIKMLFLNDLNFGDGQIVLTHEHQIPQAYRVDGSARAFTMSWRSPPSLVGNGSLIDGTDGYYPFYQAGVHSTVDTVAKHEEEFGFHRRQLVETTPSYANVPNFRPGSWDYMVAYVNTNYFGGTSYGIVKTWIGPYGQPLTLIGGAMIDAGLNQDETFNSIRLVLRPEDSSIAVPSSGGCKYAEIRIGTQPLTTPGGHALPYPGTTTPPNYPPLGGTEED